jgi:hypothetical protein
VISEYDKGVSPLGHLIPSGNCLLGFNYAYESLFYKSRVYFDERRQLRKQRIINGEF